MLEPILILLVAAVVFAGLFARFRLPSSLAYLLLGALLGPHAMGWLPDNETTRFLAEMGVIFLLFTIGLEFSVPTLLAAHRMVFGLGGLQVVLTSAAGTMIGIWCGLNAGAALLIGVALAMTSTAIVLKELRDRGELSTRHGRLAVAILIFQDLVTLPLLAVLSSLGGVFDVWLVLQTLLTAGLAFVVLAWLGRQVIRPALNWVASRHSTELFTLSALLTVVAAASFAQSLGLSAPLGAFLAGLVLGETTYRHQIGSDLHPFQATLLGLFFASIGMLLEPLILFAHWPTIAAVTFLLTVLKATGIAALIRIAGHEPGVAYRTGVILSHGDEFGLLLISLAVANTLIPLQAGQIVLASIIFSMFMAPLLIHLSGPIARHLSAVYRSRDQLRAEQIATVTDAADDHVVICGFGRTGQNVAELLRRLGRSYVALDLDPARVHAAQSTNHTVVFGDATRGPILEAVGIERARALAITFDEPRAAEKIITQARALRPSMPIIVRTRDDAHFDRLTDIGATHVMPEGLEASLMLGAQLLALLGIADNEIVRTLGAIRTDQYRSLRRYFHARDDAAKNHNGYTEERRSLISVNQDTTLREFCAAISGIEVTGIIRAGVRTDAPPPNATIRPGDVLEVCGEVDVLNLARKHLSS